MAGGQKDHRNAATWSKSKFSPNIPLTTVLDGVPKHLLDDFLVFAEELLTPAPPIRPASA